MTVLMTRIVERSNGPLVLSQLQEVQAQIGRIAQVLADQGSDIASGARLFCELVSEGTTIYAEDAALAKTPELLISNDYSHASSHILKENLEADPKWQEFLGHCGKTQPKVKQTALGALAPPTQKVKGRYMNIGELIVWAIKMIALLNGTSGKLTSNCDPTRVQLKYGWLKDFEASLQVWGEFDRLREQSLDAIRHLGYCHQAVDEIVRRQSPYRSDLRSQEMGDQLIEFARSQCHESEGNQSYPGTSEVIESLFSKFKQTQGQHSRNGFTKMALSIGCHLGELTTHTVKAAIETFREIDVRQWASHAIGDVLGRTRRQALPGTNSASKQNC